MTQPSIARPTAAQHTKASTARSHVMVVGAYAQSLINFRGPLIRQIAKCHRTTCVSEAAPASVIEQLAAWGATHAAIPIQRNGLSARQDLRTVRSLFALYRKHKPTVVLAYTIKPVIWTGMALRLVGGPRSRVRYVALITGLGYVFESGSGVRGLLQRLVVGLYRAALRRADLVIFQNQDNRNVFVERGIVATSKTLIVDGSGVDAKHFGPKPIPPMAKNGLTFLLIARLLGEKGIREYAAAAAAVRREYPDSRFILVGPEDSSPDGISSQEASSWESVDYVGPSDDVRAHLQSCHVYVLPSYHEGMPRTVLEAMAMARPILTTNVSGCRETVVDGDNGWLVPKADAEALAERMSWFIKNADRLADMGERSRQRVLERFEIGRINAQMLAALGLQDSASAADVPSSSVSPAAPTASG